MLVSFVSLILGSNFFEKGYPQDDPSFYFHIKKDWYSVSEYRLVTAVHGSPLPNSFSSWERSQNLLDHGLGERTSIDEILLISV
jgi:hypothetical protein